MMCTALQLLVAVALLAVSAQAGAAARRELAYDDGAAQVSTVIGLYRDSGQQFHQRVDFALAQVENISSARVHLHVHVGSKIEPGPAEKSCRVAVRVNSGPWHWRDLDAYRDDSDHWIEFPIPASELHAGVNHIETNSTVGSQGNATTRSLDILGSTNPSVHSRSWHTYEFEAYSLLTDRNWGIRLSYLDSSVPGSEAASLTVLPADAVMTVDEPLQLVAKALDAHGRVTDVSAVEWSASHGSIDRYGMLLADVDRPIVVTAKLGSLTAVARCKVELKPPEGVMPPGTGDHLRPKVSAPDIDLCGQWQFRKDTGNNGENQKWFSDSDSDNWGSIHVPGCWQASGWGFDYHGVGWYRRGFDLPKEWTSKQLWITFDGVATSAKVWMNGVYIGSHMGNWAPFELRATDAVHAGHNTIVVRVEELPKHFSAGFPCVIAPHFGGIWQAVSLHASGGAHLDDVAALPSLASKEVLIEATVSGSAGVLLCVVTDPAGKEAARAEQDLAPRGWDSGATAKLRLSIPDPRPWSPDKPQLYTARVEILQNGKVSDSSVVRFGMRDMVRQGDRLLLNGKPLYICGVLHWANYHKLISIDPSEAIVRREFADIRAAGFNCVKVCMFTFPRRFYEIADETGMLIWQEYPLWLTFPQEGDDAPHDDIVAEYTEWFKFDRSHASVILRDLTCESPNPASELMGRIYEIGKSLTHNQLIEDNSAAMNQVYTDWFDQHIYAELDTLHGFLPGLAAALRDKPEVKPYLTGEDFDADTCRDMPALRAAVDSGRLPKWIADGSFAMQEKMEQDLARRFSPDMPKEFVRRQKLHALALRKGMIEDFRKYPELSGYVMTHIRDNTQTRPGFYDDLDQPKWDPKQWREFTGDRVLIADSDRQSFCFRSGEAPAVKLLLSNFGDALSNAPLTWKLLDGDRVIDLGSASVSAEAGTVAEIASCKLTNAGALALDHPASLRLTAQLGPHGSIATNEWSVWFFPVPKASSTSVCVYSASGLAADLPGFDVTAMQPGGSDITMAPGAVLVTDAMDAAVRKALSQGANVVFVPEDSDISLPRQDAPFWREMAIWLPTGSPALGDFPHADFVDRQFFDMTQRRPFEALTYRDDVTPIIWGVNARFTGMLVNYVFEAKVGKGSLLACCLHVRGENNVSGQYLLDQLVRYAASDSFSPKGSGSSGLAELLK